MQAWQFLTDVCDFGVRKTVDVLHFDMRGPTHNGSKWLILHSWPHMSIYSI